MAIGGLIFVDDVELIALKPKGVMVLLLSSFNDSLSLLLAVVPDLDELSPNTNKFDEDDDTDAVGVVPVFGLVVFSNDGASMVEFVVVPKLNKLDDSKKNIRIKLNIL